MKNKITCLLAGIALFGATANADIAIADGLTAYGYIDMGLTDLESGTPGVNGSRTQDFTEYEIGLSFTPAESKWSAVVELSYGKDAGTTASTDFETATVTYQHSDALSFTAGNLYTFQGLESDDAPDNDFISYAGRDGTDLYNADYAEGVAAVYSAGDITLAAWAQGSANSSFQYYASYGGIENLSLAVALIEYDDSTNMGDPANIMATYEIGDFTISAENVDTDEGTNLGNNALDVSSVAVAYNLGDTTVAVRLVDGEYGDDDYEKTSIAAFHALSDNVSVGAEFSNQELDGVDTKGIGVELLYIF